MANGNAPQPPDGTLPPENVPVAPIPERNRFDIPEFILINEKIPGKHCTESDIATLEPWLGDNIKKLSGQNYDWKLQFEFRKHDQAIKINFSKDKPINP